MPQWCDKHKQHTIDENCADCVREGETIASLRSQLQAAEAEIEADTFRKQELQNSIDGYAQRVAALAIQLQAAEQERDAISVDCGILLKEISILRQELDIKAVEQKRDELAKVAARVVIVPCKRCGADWPHFSVLSDSPVCATCRRAVEQERDALREASRAEHCKRLDALLAEAAQEPICPTCLNRHWPFYGCFQVQDDPIATVLREIRKAAAKFPTWPVRGTDAATIVAEECGELQQAVLQATYEGGAADAVRKEAIQTAAMAIQFLLNLPDTRFDPGEQSPKRLPVSPKEEPR